MCTRRAPRRAASALRRSTPSRRSYSSSAGSPPLSRGTGFIRSRFSEYANTLRTICSVVSSTSCMATSLPSRSPPRPGRCPAMFIAIALVQIPMLLAHPQWGHAAKSFVVPTVAGEISSDAVLLIIAIVGTTVAPWQLFFQQSNVVDKRITPRFIGYERADTALGAVVVVVGAIAVLVVAVFAVHGTNLAGKFTDALGVARALQHHGYWYGALFAIVLLDASIIGASAVTLSTSYAFGDVFGLRHSLHRSFRDAKQFYLSYTMLVAVAAGVVLIPHAPLGLITTSVQALAGVLLPSASVFLLLLCNDPQVLGPWVNGRWLNIVASVI